MSIRLKYIYLIIIGILLFGYFFLYNFSDKLDGHTLCLFKTITGVPCPSCGSTRATLEIYKGNFYNALIINPLAFIANLLIVISIFWITKDILKNKNTFLPFLKRDWHNCLKIILLILILLNWVWNIEKGL